MLGRSGAIGVLAEADGDDTKLWLLAITGEATISKNVAAVTVEQARGRPP